jgi:hypothetical protein
MTELDPNSYKTRKAFTKTVTIADGATLSGALDCGGMSIVGVSLPSGFDGASLKIHAAMELGGTYQVVQDGSGTDITLVVSASKNIGFTQFMPSLFPWRFIKLQAGAQTGSVDIVCVLAAF